MSRTMVFFLIGVAPVMALSLAYLGFVTLAANALGWLLLLIGLAYFVGGPLYVWKWKGSLPSRREERGDLSFWLVLPGFILAIYGAPLEYLFLPEALPRPAWLPAAAWLLVGASMGLHIWARQTLSGQFAGHIQIQPEHRLVTGGPYRFVRHPAYLGYLLLTLGVGVGYSSLISLAAVFLLLLPGLVYRMAVEEQLLTAEFGEEYYTYARKTRRLIPGIW